MICQPGQLRTYAKSNEFLFDNPMKILNVTANCRYRMKTVGQLGRLCTYMVAKNSRVIHVHVYDNEEFFLTI